MILVAAHSAPGFNEGDSFAYHGRVGKKWCCIELTKPCPGCVLLEFLKDSLQIACDETLKLFYSWWFFLKSTPWIPLVIHHDSRKHRWDAFQETSLDVTFVVRCLFNPVVDLLQIVVFPMFLTKLNSFCQSCMFDNNLVGCVRFVEDFAGVDAAEQLWYNDCLQPPVVSLVAPATNHTQVPDRVPW